MRLRRLQWIYATCPVFFLTICTYHRRAALALPAVHEALQQFAHRADAFQVFVGRYVIMPDHMHLFATFSPVAPSLSEWVKGLKRAFAESLKRNHVPSPYWQKGFFDHALRSEESYEQKWLYVRENPVRAGLVIKAQDWPYQGEIHPLLVCRP